MTVENVLPLLALVIGILFQVIPGFREFWAAWIWRKLVWLGGCFVASFGLMGLCYAGAPVGFPCTEPFIWGGFSLALQVAALAYLAGDVPVEVRAVYLRLKWSKRLGPGRP